MTAKAKEPLNVEQFMLLFTRIYDGLAPRVLQMLRDEIDREMPRYIEQMVRERVTDAIVHGAVRKVADEARERVARTLRRAVEEDDDDRDR